jgi:hypothetical protein
LWKLLIDLRRQRKGYGQAIVRHIVEMVRAQGATELLTSNASGEGGPAGSYPRLGSSRDTAVAVVSVGGGPGNAPTTGRARVRWGDIWAANRRWRAARVVSVWAGHEVRTISLHSQASATYPVSSSGCRGAGAGRTRSATEQARCSPGVALGSPSPRPGQQNG